MQSSSSAIAYSPSFNSYSSGTLADIAARVIEEFRAESVISNKDYDDDGMFNFTTPDQQDLQGHESRITITDKEMTQGKDAEHDHNDADDDDDEFEFAFVCRDPDSSPISADEIFYNGQIKPVFPLFDTSLLLDDEAAVSNNSKPPVRLSLRKLFIEERDSPSCSSSEADELDGASPETYCVWRPKITPDQEESPGRCKKSHSTGNSSKRWKFKNLLHRSLSDGRDTFVFLTPSGSKKRTEKVEKSAKVDENSKGGVGPGVSVTDSEARKSMNRANAKEGERRRSYLPYKSDLVGLFANVNGLSRNIHTF